MSEARVPTWHGWSRRRLLIAGAFGLAAIAVSHRAWADILTIALHDEDSAHVLLVPLVVVWLAAVRRDRIRQCQPRGEWIGPAIVAVGWMLSWYGFTSGHQVFWHGGAMLVMIGAVLSALGLRVLWRFLPVFVAMMFVVPVPGRMRSAVAIPLQTATAQATQALLELFGVAVARSGNLLYLNELPVEIAETCNGMRMAFALVLVSYAYAFATPLKGYVRALILLLSPLTAIALNVIRLAPTVLLYAHADMGLARTFDRLSGWLMLLLAFVLLVGVIRLLRWALLPVSRFTLAYD